ncbi:hypothetical protein PR048_008238 [Dryococelus australis]|uniref:YqaJ viral recombinase domain-containing protein n=1 Tax=Dryococelus australis TaxID=614101 RepID=A0ABQ9HWJ4_9NEOP|nr:hypothetical protein PR048_008238 [Dryococelus australis]
MSDKDRKQKEQEILEMLQNEVKTSEDTAKLQQATVGQNDRKDDAWCMARRYRLTASKFEVVCKRAESTLCDKLVKQSIVPPILRTNAVMYGQHHEESAKNLYGARYKVKVESFGIFVPHWLPWIRASPDGLVLEVGLVEVKCIPSLGNDSLESALINSVLRKNLPVQYVTSKETKSQLEMKKSHNYYNQIQFQLAITASQWCDLFLYWPGGFECFRIQADRSSR